VKQDVGEPAQLGPVGDRDAEQYDKVFADPEQPDDLVVPWIEETLRYDTSSQMLARVTHVDCELHGQTIPKGDRVLLLAGSANRDERAFPDPDRFDLDRDREAMTIASFGAGRHFCLGASLARMETRIVLEELVRTVRDYDIDEAGARRVHSVNVRGFAALPTKVVTR
jgi:cytochrome P450